jgi:hypothetical protein
MTRGRLLAFLVLTAICLSGAWVGFRHGGAFDQTTFTDFLAFHKAAQGVWAGDLTSAYAPTQDERRFQYPPTFAFLVAPLGLLPYRMAVIVWVVVNVALVLLVAASMERILSIPLSVVARMVGLLVLLRPLRSDLSHGNANFLTFALLLGALALANRGKPARAGFALAIAVLAKLTPILALAWVVAGRRWRMLSGFVAGLILVGALLPAAVLGPRASAEAWRAWGGWLRAEVDPGHEQYAALRSSGGYLPGESLRTVLHRLLRPSDTSSSDDEVTTINFADLPPTTIEPLYVAIAAALVLLLLHATRAYGAELRSRFTAQEIATICAASVALSPYSRTAAFVAIWPAALVGFEAWRAAQDPATKWWGGLLWGVVIVLVIADAPALVGRSASIWLSSYCPLFWVAMILLILSLWRPSVAIAESEPLVDCMHRAAR